MAVSTKLVMTFTGLDNSDVNYTYKYADPDAENSDIILLMNTMIANKEIFSVQPVSAKAAKLVTTTEDDIDLSA